MQDSRRPVIIRHAPPPRAARAQKNRCPVGTAVTRFESSARQPNLAAGPLTLLARDTFEKAGQLLATDRMLKFPHRFRFNLSYTLACDLEDAAHFLQGVGIPITLTVPEADNFPFTVSESLE